VAACGVASQKRCTSQKRCNSGLAQLHLVRGHGSMWSWRNRLVPRRFRFGFPKSYAVVRSVGRGVHDTDVRSFTSTPWLSPKSRLLRLVRRIPDRKRQYRWGIRSCVYRVWTHVDTLVVAQRRIVVGVVAGDFYDQLRSWLEKC
jgi:hypothetical protein